MGRPIFSPGKKLTGGKFRPVTPERPLKYRKDQRIIGVISCIDLTSLICIGNFVFNYYKAIYVLCKSFYCPTIIIQSF